MINLYLTFGCNLECKYCYQRKESNLSKNVMTEITLNKFLDFLDFTGNFNPEQGEERVMFIGGEPLLFPEKILEFIKIFKERYPQKKFLFEITSNLTLYQPEIYKLKNMHFFVSLDGTQETHDKNRIFHDGKGSFSTVIKNLKELIKYQKEISIVYTFLPDEKPKNFVESIDFLSNFSKDVFWDIDIRPAQYTLNESNINTVSKMYEKVMDYYLKITAKGFANFSVTLIRGSLNLMKSLKTGNIQKTCGVGFSAFSLHPNGDLWPCQLYFTLKKRKIGNVFHDSPIKMKKSLNSLALFNTLAKRKAKAKKCNCPIDKICNKPPCIASYETNNFKCHTEDYLKALLLSNLQEHIKSKVSKEELNNMLESNLLNKRY